SLLFQMLPWPALHGRLPKQFLRGCHKSCRLIPEHAKKIGLRSMLSVLASARLMASPDFCGRLGYAASRLKSLCTGLRSRWRGYNSFTMSAQISSLVGGTLSAFRLIEWIFLAVAVAGTISSAIFLGLALAGA